MPGTAHNPRLLTEPMAAKPQGSLSFWWRWQAAKCERVCTDRRQRTLRWLPTLVDFSSCALHRHGSQPPHLDTMPLLPVCFQFAIDTRHTLWTSTTHRVRVYPHVHLPPQTRSYNFASSAYAGCFGNLPSTETIPQIRLIFTDGLSPLLRLRGAETVG